MFEISVGQQIKSYQRDKQIFNCFLISQPQHLRQSSHYQQSNHLRNLRTYADLKLLLLSRASAKGFGVEKFEAERYRDNSWSHIRNAMFSCPQ